MCNDKCNHFFTDHIEHLLLQKHICVKHTCVIFLQEELVPTDIPIRCHTKTYRARQQHLPTMTEVIYTGIIA